MADLFLTEDVQALLKNKYVVVVGDSVQRAVYKDLVLFLQENRYLTDAEQRRKGERTFCGDTLSAGGILSKMTNEPVYREVREYRNTFHLLQFFFVTRCFDDNVEAIINTLGSSPDGAVDVLIMNSTLWDITRYGTRGVTQYKTLLEKLCQKLKEKLPNTLILWITTLPVAEKVKGGFLVSEVEFLQDTLRLEVNIANATAVKVFLEAGFDVLDLHYFMRRQLHRRAHDGIHWDYTAHRRISNLLLTHIAHAWGCPLPGRLHKVLEQMHGSKPAAVEPKQPQNRTTSSTWIAATSTTPVPRPVRRIARPRRRIVDPRSIYEEPHCTYQEHHPNRELRQVQNFGFRGNHNFGAVPYQGYEQNLMAQDWNQNHGFYGESPYENSGYKYSPY